MVERNEGPEILAAIEALREELQERDRQDNARVESMDELREELRKERIRRQFLWTPIGILASIVAVVTFLFVDSRAEDQNQERQLCEQSNAARATITEFLDAASQEMTPDKRAALNDLAEENLSPRKC